MTISSASAATAAAIETERVTAVLRKTQDVAEGQAASLIDLVKSAPRPGVGTRLSVYA